MFRGLQEVRAAPTGARMVEFLDLCGRRWALRVVWELRGGALSFRRLRAACGGVSPGVLQSRLHEWRGLEVVESIPGLGYRLTARGEQLFQVLAPLSEWARGGAGGSPPRHEKKN